jgi:hypothetical protein
MKKLLLLACGLIFASIVNNLWAQKEGIVYKNLNYNLSYALCDTLVIKLTGSDKILVIGGNLNNLVKYTQADSVKNLFLADVEKSYANNSLSAEATKVYYFVTTAGKRRLKAENVEFSENDVNIGYELKRIDLDLPKYEFKIFDLKHGYQIQIYLANPKDLKSELEKTSINEAIKFAASNAKKEIKSCYKLEVITENGLKIGNKTQGKRNALMINNSFGISAFGNTLAPVIGINTFLEVTNKYSIDKWRVGFSYNAIAIVNTVNGEVKGVSAVSSFDLKGLINLNQFERSNPVYIGLQFGILKSNDIKSFDNAFKIGFLHANKFLNYSFDIINDTNKNTIYGLTVFLPF